MGSELSVLTQRFDRLERSCRHWRAAASLMLAALCLIIFLGATTSSTPRSIRIKSLTILDENDNPCGWLNQNGLSIFHKDGRSVLLGYGLLEDPALILSSKSGRTGIALLTNEKSAAMAFYEQPDGTKEQQLRLTLGCTVEGETSVNVIDRAGFIATLGTASLEKIKTGTTEGRTAASLVLFNKEKTVIWKAPQD